MTYRRVVIIAWWKRILGWFIFILTLLSTLISVFNFLAQSAENHTEADIIFFDFIQVIVTIIKFNTSILNFFWHYSPLPVLGQGMSTSNCAFFIIYWLMFIGLALNSSGIKMMHLASYFQKNLEEQLELENLNRADSKIINAMDREVIFPRYNILLQFFWLYFMPIALLMLGYLFMVCMGIV